MLRAIALGLCLGAWLGPAVPYAPGSLAAVPVAAWGATRLTGIWGAGLVGASCVLPAAAWRTWRIPTPAVEDLARAAPRRFLRVEGTVLSPPEGGTGRWRSLVRIDGPRWRGVTAVRFPETASRPRPGERWTLAGRLAQTLPAQNPGGFDARAFWRQRGVFSTLHAQEGMYLALSLRWDDRARRLLDGLRLRLLAGLSHGLTPDSAALLGSLVLGAGAAPVPPALASVFRDAGLAHLLAASGAQVALLGGMVLFLARAVGLGPRWAVAIALPILWLYLGLTGGTPGMVRATCMGVIGLGAIALGRSGVPFAAFWGTLIVLMLLDPCSVEDLGLQFSVLATYALLRLSHGLGAWNFPGPSWLAPALLAPIVTWLWVAPLQAQTFCTLPLMGIPANWLSGPLITLLTPWGLGLSALGVVLPQVVAWANMLTGVGVAALIQIAESATGVEGQLVAVPAVPLWLLGGFYAVLALRSWRWKVSVSIFLLACGATPYARAQTDLTVTVLSVGQGDAIVIQTASGRTVLIDGGPAGRGADAGHHTLLPFFRRMGVRHIDLMVATHAHADHLGGLRRIVTAMPVSQAWEAGAAGASGILNPLLAAWLQAGVHWETGQRSRVWQADGLELESLPVQTSSSKVNDTSLVLRLRYGDFTMLLPGDLEAAGEADLLKRAVHKLRADILKVGHHGARASSSSAWLAAVQPHLAVISAGRNNVHGHPHIETLQRLQHAGIRVARTDEEGAIQIRVTTQGWHWSTGRSGWQTWQSGPRQRVGAAPVAGAGRSNSTMALTAAMTWVATSVHTTPSWLKSLESSARRGAGKIGWPSKEIPTTWS